MPEFLSTPVGRVRIPPLLVEAGWAEDFTARFRGEEVEIFFWAASIDPAGEADGAIGEVTGHVFMRYDEFERLPDTLRAALEMHRDHGLPRGE